ncbi:hypothetical protein GCM10009548_02000 [Streptomyces malaysiensis subsp. malaysiensis]|uniref:DUF4178 domain-containing protein n=1 Tax=Streptomyces malaysiensis TaxID=92644 RepID=A0ABX6W4A6_STRMQ|nr:MULTISPECIES: hypothetical protein [Streptomyces]QPI56335.1 hypothetical protein I1A49_16550 [Streptomyces solisilvae]UHH17822.1 hypothetical protein LUV23_16665 [Streptomyces sp. HNM0561]
MSETFKADDVVTVGGDPRRNVVVSGPYTGVYDTFYVVRRWHGTVHSTALASQLERFIPAFEVGGTAEYHGMRVTLLAGPFVNEYRETWWVVQDDDRDQEKMHQNDMSNYQPPATPAPETFTHDGVTYEVGATYEDVQGDRVMLTKIPTHVNELGVLTYVANGTISGYSLSKYVRSFGPLIEVSG